MVEAFPQRKGDVHQPDQHRHFDQRADHRGKGRPSPMPKTATATAIASSKLLLAAVKDSVAVLRIVGADLLPMQKLTRNITTK